ncbi:MAG: VOC family protein [Candidatus Dormibacter sp.]
MAATDTVPELAGVHHLKLPISDVEQSFAWYQRTLGYERTVEFVEEGRLMGIGMRHPAGGPLMTLRLDPDRARAAAGFDYFSIGVPDKATLETWAARFDALGERHAGVHFATIGWILPELHDPDGHEVRFYTMEQHSALRNGESMTISDPRETAAKREAELTR